MIREAKRKNRDYQKFSVGLVGQYASATQSKDVCLAVHSIAESLVPELVDSLDSDAMDMDVSEKPKQSDIEVLFTSLVTSLSQALQPKALGPKDSTSLLTSLMDAILAGAILRSPKFWQNSYTRLGQGLEKMGEAGIQVDEIMMKDGTGDDGKGGKMKQVFRRPDDEMQSWHVAVRLARVKALKALVGVLGEQRRREVVDSWDVRGERGREMDDGIREVYADIVGE